MWLMFEVSQLKSATFKSDSSYFFPTRVNIASEKQDCQKCSCVVSQRGQKNIQWLEFVTFVFMQNLKFNWKMEQKGATWIS